ncbi:hypothetical protein LCGC14_0954200 [marine sediment metagenome]|uniref:Uncharacterized protein n=1 Tax=marine sediment metagenome TaxID=412755 RepID=A0A0F9QZM8_9ZZZZ
MSDTFRTLLRQAEQISGSATYDDTLGLSGAETYLDKSLEKDLNYLRSQVKVITGETNWYDAPGVDLASLATDEQGMSGSFANIYTFTGMDDRNDTTPTYTSQNYVTNGNDLEASIGDLDAQVKSNYDGYTALTLDAVVAVGSTVDEAITVTASGSTFSALLIYDDLHVGGDILVEGTVDGVDIAGFASVAQTFTGMDSASDSTPTYSSTNYVANSTSLEVAIGALDAAISTADVSKEVERISSPVTSGSAHTVPGSNSHAAGDGSTMDIYLNGQLIQSNTGTELRDYLESATDEIKFTFTVPTNAYLTYIIRQ